MDDLEGYLRQGEPGKAEKARAWRVAIGLQQVDGLKPSDYLIETAKQNIEGEITIQEVKQRIDGYYAQHPFSSEGDRTEEADKVSARITEILGEQTFTFSSAGYIAIHRRLFHGIHPFAGQIRDYNITKPEWVLNGETVLYASADSLKAALEHDLEQEKQFSYRGLDQQQVVAHLAQFTSNLWQVHPFGEGNTRTTAVFKAVERACLTGDFRPRQGPLCNYCSFQAWCPAFGGDPSKAAVEAPLALARPAA
jgi:fido (protein-threonine AMPylation protein)